MSYLATLGLGRPRSVLPALSLAAGGMAAVDPGVVREASFQLSFVAVAGIAALAPPMLDGLRWLLRMPLTGRGPGWWLLQGAMLAAVVSLAATLATLPLVAFNFHQLPMLGIPAMVLALPAIPLILVMSLLTAVGGAIYAPLGEVVGWVAWFLLSYLIGLVELVSRVPGSTVAVPRFSGALVWGYYGVAALLVLAPSLFRWRPRLPEARESRGPWEGIHVPRGWQVAGALALAFFAASAWYRAVPQGDGRLHVSFLDVGQGDSIFIETPQGRRMLIDGGPERLEAARALDGRLPFWDGKVDVVMATHADEDHLLGLVEVVRRRPVGTAISGQDDSALGLRWDRALEKAGLELLEVERGQIISLDESVRLEVLHPSPEWLADGDKSRNNGSTVVRVTYGEVSFLLASDVEAEAERVMIEAGVGLDSTVLKVAHHGSKTSTTVGFLGEVMPQVAVVQVGEGNQFGHPHAEVMERLNGLVGPGRVYTTVESGTLEFITDGRRLWVREGK